MIDRFEWVTRGLRGGPDKVCDVDLNDAGAYALVPTLGSIVPGWMLAIPRRKVLALRDLKIEERNELLHLSADVAKRLIPISPDFVMFEHGPVARGTNVGCGVDQAHFHIVATSLNVVENAVTDCSVDWFETAEPDPWSAIPVDREYYLISNSLKTYVGYPRAPVSQFFRRKIAALSHVPEMWDYRRWPHYENSRRTIDVFAAAQSRKAA